MITSIKGSTLGIREEIVAMIVNEKGTETMIVKEITETRTEVDTGKDLQGGMIELKKKRILTTKFVERSKKSEEVTPKRLKRWKSNFKSK